MNLFELVIDEEAEIYGIDAISLVEKPAIESDFVALKEEPKLYVLKDESKRIVMGPALVPDKPIFRSRDGEDFYIFFSKKTVRRAMSCTSSTPTNPTRLWNTSNPSWIPTW